MQTFWSGPLRDEADEGQDGGQPSLFPEGGQEPKGDDELAALKERIAAQDRKLEEQGGFLKQFFQRPQQSPQRPQQPNPDARKQFEEQFYADPAGMTARIAQQQAAQMSAQQIAQLRAELHPQRITSAKTAGRDADPEVFDKYRPEIEQWVQSTYPVENHDNEFVWKQALAAVKSDKFDEIAQWKAERKKAASLNPPSRRGNQPEEPKGLSDDEKQAARLLGMTEKQYEDARAAHLKDRHSPAEGRDMVNSGWSNVITLDSRKPRNAA